MKCAFLTKALLVFCIFAVATSFVSARWIEDAALFLSLNPGAYSITLTDVAGVAGTAMIEVYRLAD